VQYCELSFDSDACVDVGGDAGEYESSVSVTDTRAILDRYAAQARKYPLLTHAALVEFSRAVYVEHHRRLCCITQLPATIETLVALNTRRRRRELRWTSFVCAVGDQSPDAKDRVLERIRSTTGAVPPNGYPDHTVSREDHDVVQCLDDLELLHDAFMQLAPEQRVLGAGDAHETLARHARRIELRWDTFEQLVQRFVEITDAFRHAKRALVSAAADLPADAPAVDSMLEAFLVAHDDPAARLRSVLGSQCDEHEIAVRIARPLAELRNLELRHSRACEVVLELRRHFDAAEGALRLAVNQIVLRNLLLVIKEVGKTDATGEDLLDAIQEGNDGLAVAAERFKYYAGTRFSTYAAFWIQQRLRRFRITMRNLYAIPIGVVHDCIEVSRVRARLTKVNGGRAPTVHQIAEAMQVPMRKVMEAEAAYVPHDSDAALEYLPGDEPDHEDVVAQQQLQELVREALSTLPGRQAEIARLRFGIGQERAYTLVEVAEMCALSPERVRFFEKDAVQRLLQGRFGPELRLFLS
jgi:RNA polymerase sigma factor (sigma-70 family)